MSFTFRTQEIQQLKAECRELSSKLEASELQRQRILREQQEVQEASKQTAAWWIQIWAKKSGVLQSGIR